MTDTMTAVDLASYDTFIVAFSGGKDSLACLLHLIESGVPRERIELWHHDVDGREGSTLMDWACTRDYCRKVAEAFGVKIYAAHGVSQYVAFTRDKAQHVADGCDFLRVRELAEEHTAEEGEATVIIDVDCVNMASGVVLDSGVVWRSDGGVV
jgi:tRNA(Ile)-lysidine synthase TilS/MesJ